MLSFLTEMLCEMTIKYQNNRYYIITDRVEEIEEENIYNDRHGTELHFVLIVDNQVYACHCGLFNDIENLDIQASVIEIIGPNGFERSLHFNPDKSSFNNFVFSK